MLGPGQLPVYNNWGQASDPLTEGCRVIEKMRPPWGKPQALGNRQPIIAMRPKNESTNAIGMKVCPEKKQ